MKDRELYSIEDARFLLGGIARKTIYELLNEGELASVIIGRRRFIPAAAITSFIATTVTNTAPALKRATGRHRSVQMTLALEPGCEHRRRANQAPPSLIPILSRDVPGRTSALPLSPGSNFHRRKQRRTRPWQRGTDAI